MRLNSIYAILAVVATWVAGSTAQAVPVTQTSSATFAFDFSSIGEFNASSFTWCGYDPILCSGGGDSSEDQRLSGGASFQLNFGTTIGGADLGSRIFTNPSPSSADNFASILSPNVLLDASLDTVYVTLVFIDDIFGAEALRLVAGEQRVMGQLLPTSEVPLPAALPLFLAGAAGLSLTARKRKRAS